MAVANFDIILVSAGSAELTQRCLMSIERHTVESDGSRLLWIDNMPERSAARTASPPDSLPVVYLPMPENLGWVKAANVGLAMSTAPFVVLMNDDTEVCTPNWLHQMARSFSHHANVGVVCPRHDNHWDVGLLEPNQGTVIVRPKWTLDGFGIGDAGLGFSCAMFTRTAIEFVGYLDELFSPGYADDDDWLYRAYQSGLLSVCNTDVLVKHVGMGTFSRKDREVLQGRNAEMLRTKHEWSLTRPVN